MIVFSGKSISSSLKKNATFFICLSDFFFACSFLHNLNELNESAHFQIRYRKKKKKEVASGKVMV